jgi:hypothetical protein
VLCRSEQGAAAAIATVCANAYGRASLTALEDSRKSKKYRLEIQGIKERQIEKQDDISHLLCRVCDLIILSWLGGLLRVITPNVAKLSDGTSTARLKLCPCGGMKSPCQCGISQDQSHAKQLATRKTCSDISKCYKMLIFVLYDEFKVQ